MNQFIENTQTFARDTTLIPPPTQNVEKCGFWCKAFKVVKVVTAFIAPPVALVMEGADLALGISKELENIDDKNAASGQVQRGAAGYIQPSQQVRQGKLNLM